MAGRTSIYAFDNNTGMDIPTKVDVYPVEILLGTNVNEVKSGVLPGAKIFCVFTKLQDYGFVVPTKELADKLQNILTFGKIRYEIGVKDTSMWYSDNASINLLISSSCKLRADQISMIISSMIGLTSEDGSSLQKEIPEMYIIVNTRNSRVIHRTLQYTEAVKLCDKNPCTMIVQRSDNRVIYKSMYGKVNIPTTNETQMSKYKSRLLNQHTFNIGNIR